MGLLGDLLGSKRMKDPVRGTAHVVACTEAPHATHGTARMTLVVSADGVPSTPVEHHQIAPVAKWPYAGTTVPVTVDRARPDRLRVEFDELPDAREQAWEQAQALAGGGGVSHQTYTVSNLDELPPEIQQQLQGIGLDLRALADAHAAQADGDLTDQLAKLAELRASGALSEDEFAAAKRKLLG
jgi:hypothetical protein